MKLIKNGNLAKLVAFFVIAAVMTCTVSFAANGWQSFVDDELGVDNPSSQLTDSNNNNNSNNDDNSTDKPADNSEDVPAVAPMPVYIHYLTGLETTADISVQRPLCFSISSNDPLYGISSSFLTIEFPTEYGETRFLSFTNDAKNLGKIGSVAPTRGYISNLATYFGGILLSYGNDDSFSYSSDEPDSFLDFASTLGYCYTEYNNYIYTNGDLISAFINNSKINTLSGNSTHVPYSFTSIDNPVLGDDAASVVTISFSDGNTTSLAYSSTDKKYTLSKNNTPKNDLLNDKSITYDNVFVLYVDSTTYETTDATQLILATNTQGCGRYISQGKVQDFTWSCDSLGNLTFYNENGEKLTINPGTSYIGYVKSSAADTVKVS